jgi:hypothetical protein
MLGGISVHRMWAMSHPPLKWFTEDAVAKVDVSDPARTIAESMDARARHNAATGVWHPFHVSMVSQAGLLRYQPLTAYIAVCHNQASPCQFSSE